MKPNRMFLFLILILFLASLVSRTTVCAISDEPVYIYDKDNIINDKTERKLNQMLDGLNIKTGVWFYVISVKNLLDNSIETYSDIVFNELDNGKSEKDNRVLLLFSRSDKKAIIKIGSGLEGCLNDLKCDQILDNYFFPYSEKDNYSKATNMTVKSVLSVLAKEYNISIKDLEDVYDYDGVSHFVIMPLILLLLVAYITKILQNLGICCFYS